MDSLTKAHIASIGKLISRFNGFLLALQYQQSKFSNQNTIQYCHSRDIFFILLMKRKLWTTWLSIHILPWIDKVSFTGQNQKYTKTCSFQVPMNENSAFPVVSCVRAYVSDVWRSHLWMTCAVKSIVECKLQLSFGWF